jgi:hypothetical protein
MSAERERVASFGKLEDGLHQAGEVDGDQPPESITADI